MFTQHATPRLVLSSTLLLQARAITLSPTPQGSHSDPHGIMTFVFSRRLWVLAT